MRGCAAVLLLLVSLSSFADCNWALRYSAPFRTTALDVSTSGGFVWLATGYGVQLLSTDAEILDAIALPGATRVVQVAPAGDLAYAGSGAQIIVLRREGNSVRVAGSVTAGGTVNDLLIAGSYLFAATSNGIEQYELFNPVSPVKTTATLFTSSPNVTSLAVARNVLYAADGDATVETYTIAIPSLPQGTGSLETFPRATAVHATSDGWIFVSDRFGQNTDMFNGTARLARVPFGATAFAPSATPFVHFVAGPDRTVRAVDFSNAANVAERFEAQLAPTDGTDNVIHALDRAGDTLYVAAGDIGLITYDVGSIARPYPVAGYSTGARNSVAVHANEAWVAQASGRITELTVDASGVALAETRNWQTLEGAVVRDYRDDLPATTLHSDFLLVTSGTKVQVWDVTGPVPPALSFEAQFADAVTDGVLGLDHTVVVRLANGGIWIAGATSAPAKVNIPNIALIARSGDAIAFAQVRETEEDTVLHYYATGDLSAEPRRITVDGVATGSIALDATRAALFTFNGINVVDLAGGVTRVIAGSNRAIPRQLLFAGDDLIALDTRRLYVYEDARTLVREQYLPADTVDGATNGTVAVFATLDGTAASLINADLPVAVSRFSNTYYEKAVSGGNRVYLLDDEGIDVFDTSLGAAPRYVTGIRAAGVIDVAATAAALYTLTGNGTISAWSPSGALLAQRMLDEGPDAQPLAIFTAGDAVWVSLSRSCSIGNCEKATVVFHPATLDRTASFTGGIDDVASAGNRAFVLSSLPDGIRAIDISDPLHPTAGVTVNRPAGARSIAYDGTSVHVLADRIYSFDNTLTATGTQLDPLPSTADHHVRVAGSCILITGRSDRPQLYNLPDWSPAATPEVPSPVSSVALQDGRLLLLTGHSLEIWATGAVVEPGKRRAVR
ncbi:MAG TPA: hypothetical protein VEK57_14675 [Thermoanaerobaculia bacterium]|nr:hypothetical protein [Thermoanaerobaculia bacterium]